MNRAANPPVIPTGPPWACDQAGCACDCAALDTYRVALDSIADPVSVIDAEEIYRMVNAAWCRATGLTPGSALGRSVGEIVPHAYREERRRARQECMETGQPRQVCNWVELPKLGRRLFETTYFPYADAASGARWVVMISHDMTEQEQARSAALTQAEYLRLTLNATGDGILAADDPAPEARFAFINDQALRMWGLAPERAATLTAGELRAHIGPLLSDLPGEAERMAEIIAGHQAHESKVQLRDGRVLLRRCVPTRLGERELRVWSMRDISAEQRALARLQASEAEQRALLDAFPGYIARLDAQLTYTYANRPLAALMGRTPEQVVGRTAVELLGSQRAQTLRPLMERALAGEVLVYEHGHPGPPGGEPVDVQVTMVPGVDPRSGAPAVYGFAIDVGARVRAEAALVQARDEAQRANQAKSQFLAHMSHELRTPMNAILGFGQLLESDAGHPLPPHQQAWLAQMLGGAQHLLSLINEMLDLGRIEAGQMLLEVVPVALDELVPECLALVQALAQRHTVTLLPAQGTCPGVRVAADRMRLKQVLLNLLGNAIKYNRPGGKVWLQCRVEQECIWIAVSDSGAGLSSDELSRLFQPFERLAAAHSRVEGAGLGLALSQRLVQAMGGTIGAESQPGCGSTFWLRLPMAAQRAPGGAANATEPAAAPGQAGAVAVMHTVLYIEDNPVNVVLMQAMLARLPGLRLLTAQTAAKGLQLALSARPDLVLLDIGLPGMDGFEVLARLRTRAATRHTPVVAVSANALPADVQAAMAAGFNAYLTKPLALAQLLATVQGVLGAKE
jgi:PAS domain S-box-containing protein